MKTSDGRNGTNREIPFWNQQQRGLQAQLSKVIQPYSSHPRIRSKLLIQVS